MHLKFTLTGKLYIAHITGYGKCPGFRWCCELVAWFCVNLSTDGGTM